GVLGRNGTDRTLAVKRSADNDCLPAALLSAVRARDMATCPARCQLGYQSGGWVGSDGTPKAAIVRELSTMAYAPGFIRITTAAVASVLLALGPLAAAFVMHFEFERGSLALVDPKLGGGPHAHETEVTAVTFDGASAI